MLKFLSNILYTGWNLLLDTDKSYMVQNRKIGNKIAYNQQQQQKQK